MQVCVRTGWTRDVVLDELDVPFVERLHDEWRETPPVADLVAAFVGYKPPRRFTPGARGTADLPTKADLLAAFGGGPVRVQGRAH